jgi:hypothetical protein
MAVSNSCVKSAGRLCRTLHLRSFALVLLLIPLAAADDRHIGTIDFYGYSTLDLRQLRSLLPFHAGDPLPSKKSLTAAEPAYAKAIGRGRVSFATICCLPDGRWSVFVGLDEPGIAPVVFNPQPHGSAKLPAHIMKLNTDIDQEVGNAVRNGQAGEDDSHGYSLSEYPPARAMQLKLREYARAHTKTLIEVLESCPDEQHRAAAAETLGFADESRKQIAALVRASLDSSDDVRNNAIRALGVLVDFDPKAVAQIPLKPYIGLMHSIDWLDRNKAVFLIDSFTKSRDPEVLRVLRSDALVPLREIAQWQDSGHAGAAISVLGRIAGMDEQRITDLVIAHNPAPILEALR